MANSWTSELQRRATAYRGRLAPEARARASHLLTWVEGEHFTADREPVDFGVWRFLRPIYAAVPQDLTDFDWVIKKSAQCGASIFAMLWALHTALKSRVQMAYFLPTARKAYEFSSNRFIRLARENKPIHALMGDPDTPHERRVVDEGSASARRILHSIVYFTSLEGKVSTESSPLDALVFDEVQEMMLATIEKAEERLSASTLKAKLMVSTANYVGADIDYFFERSDQREFFSRCRCVDGTVLSEHWDPRSGPLCIDRGNGTTPSVPDDYFYFCPRCRTIIADPQDGEYRPRNPGVRRVGWHFPQMLSPRQTPRSIFEKWVARVDVKNFYNRVLGLAFTDPNTQPITEALLAAAQNPDLHWGPPRRADVEAVYMGVDQMQHNHHVVIKALTPDGKQRLLHLEVVQDSNPWRRTWELMSEFHVRYCAIEALPNTDPAYLFAREFPGRVFVVDHYHEHGDSILLWGDRPQEKVTIRRSTDEFKTRYTAQVDQYKMMSAALGRWTRGEVETPDARTLTQRMRTDTGERSVQICRDVFWTHLQRVALVTELPEGREDERKPRRAVKKIGIDPHFAFAWMLSEVAFARAYSTTFMVGGDVPPRLMEDPTIVRPFKPLHLDDSATPYQDQLTGRLPGFVRPPAKEEQKVASHCGDCVGFKPKKSFCETRNFYVRADLDACEYYKPKPEADVD